MTVKTRSSKKYPIHHGQSKMHNHYAKYCRKEGLKIRNLGMFTSIINDFHQEIMNMIIMDQFIFKAPFGTGEFYLAKIKQRIEVADDGTIVHKAPIDWRKTIAMWEEDPQTKIDKKYIKYMNEHTNGYRFILFWDRMNSRFKNKRFYKFMPLQQHFRTLGAALLAGETDTAISSAEYLNSLSLKK